MGKFRSRPVVVDAIQYTGDLKVAKKFLGIKDANYDADSRDLIIAGELIDSVASVGDWIVKEESGVFNVLSGVKFRETYEEVEEIEEGEL